jgi:hypothetical protein
MEQEISSGGYIYYNEIHLVNLFVANNRLNV